MFGLWTPPTKDKILALGLQLSSLLDKLDGIGRVKVVWNAHFFRLALTQGSASLDSGLLDPVNAPERHWRKAYKACEKHFSESSGRNAIMAMRMREAGIKSERFYKPEFEILDNAIVLWIVSLACRTHPDLRPTINEFWEQLNKELLPNRDGFIEQQLERDRVLRNHGFQVLSLDQKCTVNLELGKTPNVMGHKLYS